MDSYQDDIFDHLNDISIIYWKATNSKRYVKYGKYLRLIKEGNKGLIPFADLKMF